MIRTLFSFHRQMPRALAVAICLAPCLAGFGAGGAQAQSSLQTALAAPPDTARAMMANSSPLLRDLTDWALLKKGEGTFSGAVAVLDARPTWPATVAIRAQAETLIDADTPPAQIRDFFETVPPLTGHGALAYARALNALREQDRAQAVLIDAWRRLPMTASEESAVLVDHAALLASHHTARADAMIRQGEYDTARRMIPRLSREQGAVAAARIAYLTDRNVTDAAAAVPSSQAHDAGLAQARFIWLARSGRRTEAADLLSAQSALAGGLGDPAGWAAWRLILARDAMDKGAYLRAYDLAAQHALNAAHGQKFAQLEWLAGYIALRYLNAPEVAAHHFEVLRQAVKTPISTSRAAYWLGRSRAALGEEDAARAAYAAAADLPFTYYGQLAADRLGRAPNHGTAQGQQPGAIAGRDRDLVAGLEQLLAAGERGSAYLFAQSLGQHAAPETLRALARDLLRQQEPFYTLRLGKALADRGVYDPAALFPMHPLSAEPLRSEPALALAIARQESEFRADAGSPAGALGLMQVMPATARQMALAEGVPFRQASLIHDWRYNARLGAAYLHTLQERYGDSPVLIAAAYNAGPSRVDQWLAAHGDPRLGKVDPVDWVEDIPFAETRNYVMRVTEALPIYRAQLSGQGAQSSFHDLLIGAEPRPRPKARPDGLMARHRPVQAPATPEPDLAAPPVAVPSAPLDHGANDESHAPVVAVRPKIRP